MVRHRGRKRAVHVVNCVNLDVDHSTVVVVEAAGSTVIFGRFLIQFVNEITFGNSIGRRLTQVGQVVLNVRERLGHCRMRGLAMRHPVLFRNVEYINLVALLVFGHRRTSNGA